MLLEKKVFKTVVALRCEQRQNEEMAPKQKFAKVRKWRQGEKGRQSQKWRQQKYRQKEFCFQTNKNYKIIKTVLDT
jgi:hypothetical protein